MTLCITKNLEELLGSDLKAVESPSLRLNKLLVLTARGKQGQIEAVIKCHNNHVKKPEIFKPTGAVALYMKLGGRLIVNQAGGVLENAGLCLHRNFGYPYIPGSAVKGAARHYAWELWKAEEHPEKKRKQATDIASTFGFPTGDEGLDAYLEGEGWEESRSGSVAFLPAMPTAKPALATDILTCHHMKYYAGDTNYLQRTGGKALDNEEPNPQPFPAVEAGVTFCFQIVPLKGVVNLAFAEQMLKEALEINGVSN